jgi:hypothetical protein
MNWKEAELLQKALYYKHQWLCSYGRVEDLFIAPLDARAYGHFLMLYKQLLNMGKTLRHFQKEELGLYVKLPSTPGCLIAKQLTSLCSDITG